MRLVEIPIMTLAGVWQGIRQDFNLLEIALIAAGLWAWNSGGWRPRPERGGRQEPRYSEVIRPAPTVPLWG